jgi:hypothetical protein
MGVAEEPKEEEEEELTEDQKERIKANREHALNIRRKRESEQQQSSSAAKRIVSIVGNDGRSLVKLVAHDENEKQVQSSRGQKKKGSIHNSGGEGGGLKEEEVDDILESFEVGAPTMITKREAMMVYCLPEGTLAVCQCVEKENPHRKGWSAMKLYYRSEIRRRARDRFGGLQGLIAERKSREIKRCINTMKKTKDIFDCNAS